MANKFQKAVENRTSEILKTGKEEVAEKEEILEPKEIITEKKVNDLPFLDETIVKSGKTKSLYLEENVLKKLKELSEKHNVSESKLVNEILKNFLK